MTLPRQLAATLSLALLAGCAEDPAPAEPTWAADVAPILRANCVRCHADPAIEGAPEGFVLDRPDGYTTDDGRVLLGARNMAFYVAVRATDRSMPPDVPLTDRQVEILERFADLPAEDSEAGPTRYGPVLGAPRPGNRPPSLRLEPGEVDADGLLSLGYALTDPDGDLVTGRLEARAGAATRVISTALLSGRGELRWDVDAMPAGTAALVAVLDDGSGAIEQELGSRVIDAGGGQAPTVAVSSVAGGLVTEADTAPGATVRIDAAAADAAVLRLSVDAERDGERIAIASDLPAVIGDNPVALSATEIPAGDGWRLRATVSTPSLERVALSPPFSVGRGDTELRWADVEPLFTAHCTVCHFGAGSTLHLPWDFGTRAGVVELRGAVHRRVAISRTMPPVSASIVFDKQAMSDDDRDRISRWLLAGAPE
jgi:hypothetical protein